MDYVRLAGACPETDCAWWLSTWRFSTPGSAARRRSTSQADRWLTVLRKWKIIPMFHRHRYIPHVTGSIDLCSTNLKPQLFQHARKQSGWDTITKIFAALTAVFATLFLVLMICFLKLRRRMVTSPRDVATFELNAARNDLRGMIWWRSWGKNNI